MRLNRFAIPAFSSVLAFALMFAAPNALAAAGDLDTGFSIDGSTAVDILGSWDRATAVALQDDRKLVLVGPAHNGVDNDFAVVRLLRNGTLDDTFGGDGKVSFVFAPAVSDYANDVAIQPDGRIVVAGNSDGDLAVARLDPGGGLDDTFSGNGKATLDLGGSVSGLGVAVQGDGKIVVAGTNNDVILARYLADGTLDTTFGGGDGVVVKDLDAGSLDRVSDMALQPNGKIVVVGSFTATGGQAKFLVARFKPGGALDKTFSGDGRAVTAFGTHDAETYSVALQSDGRIVVSGWIYDDGTGEYLFALTRYKVGGALDDTFGGDGRVTTECNNCEAYQVLVQGDGKIVAAGYAGTPSDAAFLVARYRKGGALDGTFGAAGTATAVFPEGISRAEGAVIQANGRIVAAGRVDVGATEDMAVARFLAA